MASVVSSAAPSSGRLRGFPDCSAEGVDGARGDTHGAGAGAKVEDDEGMADGEVAAAF